MNILTHCSEKLFSCIWALLVLLLLSLFTHAQKSIKPEKEGEEKVKKPRFHNILNPPRRLSRVDSTSGQDFAKVIAAPPNMRQHRTGLMSVLFLQLVKLLSWTSSVRQSIHLRLPSRLMVLPPALDGSADHSRAKGPTLAASFPHPPPPPHTALPHLRAPIPVGRTQTPVRFTSIFPCFHIII